MSRVPFSQRRGAQWAAWFLALFSVVVIFTGYLIGPPQPVLAQDSQTAEQVAPADGQPATNTAAQVADPLAQAKHKVGHSPSSILDKGVSFFGVLVFLGLAFLMSNNRGKINWRLVGWGVGLQVVFAMFIFYVPGGDTAFEYATKGVDQLLGFTAVGSDFLFNSFATGKREIGLINFAFSVLPTIIFFSSLMTILYHIGVMHRVVAVFAFAMQKTMGTSGAESLSAAANIFVGQTEAPLVVKPYVNDMTVSELMTVMTGGFATVAGGVMAIYVGMLKDTFPDIAGHLIAASIMSAPAALVIGKIMVPETHTPVTAGGAKMEFVREDVNVLDAASRGAAEGLKLALNVGAMLLAFIAIIALMDALIALPQTMVASAFDLSFVPITIQKILGFFFWPFAWVMGVPTADCMHIGELLGIKMAVNELVAYGELSKMLLDPKIVLQDRSVIIATYALCGFANFGSIGIQLGGIGGIAPDRKGDLAKIAFKAMLGGTLAAFMTATIAGILV